VLLTGSVNNNDTGNVEAPCDLESGGLVFGGFGVQTELTDIGHAVIPVSGSGITTGKDPVKVSVRASGAGRAEAGAPGAVRRDHVGMGTRLGGSGGNERLTVGLAIPLLALLAVEVLTTLDLPSYLSVHLFLGLVLLPAVSLKLASTSWRAARYYTGSAEYRRLGPPRLLLRLLAPPLVVATVVLFASGVAFLAVHGTHPLRTIHTFAFVAWGVIMVVHVIAYLPNVIRDGLADWRPRETVAGSGLRRAVLLGTVGAGVVLALATYSAQTSWLAGHGSRHGRETRRAAQRNTRAPAAS
jgi:hypothetical protein